VSRTTTADKLLQDRLALMYRVGFLISATFLFGVVVVRGLVGSSPVDELLSVSRWFHILATLLCGALWLRLRGERASRPTLERLDGLGIVLLSALFNLNAGLFQIRTVAVFNLVLTTGVPAMLRAVLVPSSARRTLALGLVSSATAVTIFFASAMHPSWPIQQELPAAGWPLPYQAISIALWLSVLVAIATLTSRVVYHLRDEVQQARRLGQYILRDKLGEGGMGVVYRATHAMLRRETAIKLLLPNKIDGPTLARFEKEVVSTARLRHPNTVAIFDYGRTLDGVFYYAMEYLDGVTVDELVDQEGPLPPGRVVWLLDQVCAALEEAHGAGLVHRDIKPANVMVVGRIAAYDFVKVVDFGLVKSVTPDGATSVTAEEQDVVGTPLYMAPESITDPDAVDARSDLYAVAAVGYFMLTGTNVFDGATLVEICAAHLHTIPPPPSERLGEKVAPSLEELLMRGLAKSPDDRPASAAAFREDLAACEVRPWTRADAQRWWEARPRESRLSSLPTERERTVELVGAHLSSATDA
jgi:serine/threonine-protein kinase